MKQSEKDFVDPTDYRCNICKVAKIDGSIGACKPCVIGMSAVLFSVIAGIVIGLVKCAIGHCG